MRWKPKLKERKQKKGKCANWRNRYECRIHGQNKYGLVRCSRPFCIGWFICPLCHISCPACRLVLTNHPVLGKLDKYVGKVGYWSETQMEDYEKGFAKDEEDGIDAI